MIQVGSVELETSNEQEKGGSQFSSFSRGKTSVMKQRDGVPMAVKGKIQWDPLPVTYTELFPKLVKIGHIEPFQLPPLTPHFQDGTMPTFDVTTMPKIQATQQKIVLRSNARSEICSRKEN